MRKPQRRMPHTPEEWQAAIDAAHALLALDSARQYGLIVGGPAADVDWCEYFLKRGRRKGITPRPDAVDEFLRECL